MSAPIPGLLCGPLNVSLLPNSMFLSLTYQDWVSALAAATSTTPVSLDLMSLMLVIGFPMVKALLSLWLISINHSPFSIVMLSLSKWASAAALSCCREVLLESFLLCHALDIMSGPPSPIVIVLPSLALAGVTNARSCLSLMFLLQPFHWPCIW